MTISEFEQNVRELRATPSQREAGAFLDLMGMQFFVQYGLLNCEEMAAGMLGYPTKKSETLRTHDYLCGMLVNRCAVAGRIERRENHRG